MARVPQVHTIDAVARKIGENLALIEVVSANRHYSLRSDFCLGSYGWWCS
jgi:hypothetical protein